MFYKTAVCAAAFSALSTFAFGQGFTGGQLSIEYNAPTSGDDFGGTTYSGGLEYSINRQFAVAVDASSYRLDNINTTASSFTLHGIYHLSESASVGAFAGQDSASDSNVMLYGIEGGTEFSGGVIGGYFALSNGDSDDATMFGLDASYALNEAFTIVGDLDVTSLDDDTATNISVGAEYQMPRGPKFYGHIGSLNADGNGVGGNETYVGLGARIEFGAARGTTFDQRSRFETLAGF